jgi:hypothetical protein
VSALEGVSPGDALQVPLLARVGIVCALSAQLDVLQFLAQVACEVARSAAARLRSWCQIVSLGEGPCTQAGTTGASASSTACRVL